MSLHQHSFCLSICVCMLLLLICRKSIYKVFCVKRKLTFHLSEPFLEGTCTHTHANMYTAVIKRCVRSCCQFLRDKEKGFSYFNLHMRPIFHFTFTTFFLTHDAYTFPSEKITCLDGRKKHPNKHLDLFLTEFTSSSHQFRFKRTHQDAGLEKEKPGVFLDIPWVTKTFKLFIKWNFYYILLNSSFQLTG